MRSHKVTKGDLGSQSADQLLAELLANLNHRHENHSQHIETLKKFHNYLKVTFSRSNTLLTLSQKTQFEHELNKNIKSVSLALINCLIQYQSNLLRILALKCVLYLSHLSQFNTHLQNLNINIYIIRIIDLDLSIHETTLCIDHIRLTSQLYPQYITEAHFYCLLSSVEDVQYSLNNLILETLLELTCKYPKLACECQVFTELINYVVNVGTNGYIEVIMQTFLKCLDQADVRNRLRFDDLFASLIAPFVDFEYVGWVKQYVGHQSNPSYYVQLMGGVNKQRAAPNGATSSEPNIESVISACSQALLCVFNSYIGTMCFSTGEAHLVRNLLIPFSWFIKANLNKASTSAQLSQLFAFSMQANEPSNHSKKLTKQQLIISRQMTILNSLVDLLYKLFLIRSVSTEILVRTDGEKRQRTSTLGGFQEEASELFQEGFVNAECSGVFDSLDNLIAQSDIDELIDERKSVVSSGPNLTTCFRAYLLVLFIEAGMFEALLDLYFGLPLSYLQYSTDAIRANHNRHNITAQYQNLSYKVLHLFAALYYTANNTLSNEYSIDDFAAMKKGYFDTAGIPNLNKFYNQGIYSEFKRSALLYYLRNLNDQVREREVITYLTEYVKQQDNLKNGSALPMWELTQLSFFSQQFLNNSGFTGTAKFKAELELLHVEHVKNEMPMPAQSEMTKTEVKEYRKMLGDLESVFHAGIDATQVLQVESNLSVYDPHYGQTILTNVSHFHWHEIIKMFETFLLVESSMLTRFTATKEALFFDSNPHMLNTDTKFLKFIKKLFAFYIPTGTPNSRTYPSADIKLSLSNQIACVGVYLIDFILRKLQLTSHSVDTTSNNALEYTLIEFLQNIKLHLSLAFLPQNITASSSHHQTQPHRALNKDSVLAYHLLFIGHLTSTERGNTLLESFKMYDLISKIIEVTDDLATMKLVVSTINFYISIKARSLLEKCLMCQVNNRENLTHTDLAEFRVYVLKLIFNMFRANRLKFHIFFIDILITSLINNSLFNSPKSTEIDDLNEQLIIELTINLIEYLLNMRPDFVDAYFEYNIFNKDKLRSLKQLSKSQGLVKSKVILTKLRMMCNRFLLSKHVEVTVEKMAEIEEEWTKDKMDVRCYQLLERSVFNARAINEYFTDDFDERLNGNGEANQLIKLYRRINDQDKNERSYSAALSQIYTPFHLNSLIIRMPEFEENGFFLSEKFQAKMLAYLQVIKESFKSTKLNLKKLKSALWSVGCLLNCETGFRYISFLNKQSANGNLFEFAGLIVKLAESHDVLSIRSTAFFCLNYISKTCTGANLLGKLGWHTFQPNCAVQTKAFYSTLSSFTSEQLDLNNFYSSLNVAIVLYNLNRSKTLLGLKKIMMDKIDISQFPSEDREFLDTQMSADLIHQTDECLMNYSEQNLVKIGFFHENLTLPMLIYLMAPEVDRNVSMVTSSLGAPLKKPQEFMDYHNRCNRDESCVECKLKASEKVYSIPGLVEDRKTMAAGDEVRLQIVNLIRQYLIMTQLFSLEKSRVGLLKLKLAHAARFDICLHDWVSRRVLGRRKVPFHLRKFIQELFIDMFLEVLV